MLKRGSNEGLNILTVVLGTISVFCSVANGVNQYWDDFLCCSEIEWYRCSEILLAWIQLVTWFALWHVVYITCLVTWPQVSGEAAKIEQHKQKRLHWGLFFLYMCLVCACAGVVLCWNWYYPARTTTYQAMDNAIGVIAAVTMAAYLAPQVYTTWNLKDQGSLSMVTVILSVVGSTITTYFLIRYDAGPLIYVPGLVAAWFFVVLFIMCAYFALKQKKTFLEFIWPSDLQAEESSVNLMDGDKVKFIL